MFFFFKQKTAYEMRISDWSSDVCSSDLGTVVGRDDHGYLLVRTRLGVLTLAVPRPLPVGTEVVLQVRSIGPQVILNLLPLNATKIGRASCRERVCQYV